MRPFGARPTAIEPVPAITPTPQPSGVPAATTRSPSLTITSRRAQRASSAHPAEDFTIVGPVESRQSEADDIDRCGCEPGGVERGADRRIERPPGGFRTDGLGVRRPGRAPTKNSAPRLSEPGLRGRTSAIDAEQPYAKFVADATIIVSLSHRRP